MLSGHTPDEILNADLYFIDKIGLKAVSYTHLDVYKRQVFVRDANGKILLEPATDKDGNPNAKAGLPQVTTDKAAKIGNFNPDWTLGWSNTVTYKGFSLYFLIDARVGGDVISLTQAGLDYAGVSKATGCLLYTSKKPESRKVTRLM